MKKALSLLMVGMLVAFLFAGCQPAPAAPEEAPVVEQPSAEEAVEEVAVSGDLIGIVLPTKQETRWLGDEAKFKKIIEEKGYNAEILFSQNSSAIEKTNVETLISKGAKVIILCPYDATAAAAAVKDAEDAGIPVISYDRLILDTDAVDFYVTFDSMAVGAAQAKYLVDQAGDTQGNNLYMYSGALTDNNSFLFFEGAWSVLQPKIADGTFVIRNSSKAVEFADKLDLTRDEMADIMSSVDTEWSMDVSKSLAEAHLTANDASAKGLVYVLGPADDDCARSLSDTFYSDAEIEKIIIAGADGVEASVQYIIDGKQNMTVYKDPNALVVASMNIADLLLAGKEVPFDKTYNNNVIDVPSIQADVVTVTADNIAEVFFEGGVYDGSKFTGWQ
jgi:putative multiple sugar transport system substrate-binding protein